MEERIKINSTALKLELSGMQKKMTRVKDSLKWMEEQAAILKDHWQGEAGETWSVTFRQWLQTDMECVLAMQKILTSAEQMGILISTVEKRNNGLVSGG